MVFWGTLSIITKPTSSCSLWTQLWLMLPLRMMGVSELPHSSLWWAQNCLPARKRVAASRRLDFSSLCLLLSSLAKVFLKTSGWSLWTPILCPSEVSMAVIKHHYCSVLDLRWPLRSSLAVCDAPGTSSANGVILARPRPTFYLKPSACPSSLCSAVFLTGPRRSLHLPPCTQLSWQSWSRN